MSEQIFEAAPPKSVLEKALEQLAIGTADIEPKKGTSSARPALTPADVSAALSGYNDPLGNHLLGAMIQDGKATTQTVKELDRLGWVMWRAANRAGWITVQTHYRLCQAALIEVQRGKRWEPDALDAFLGIGKQKKRHLIDHYQTLTRLLYAKLEDLTHHLKNALKQAE